MLLLSLVQDADPQMVDAVAPHQGMTGRSWVLALMLILPAISMILVGVGSFRLKSILNRIKLIKGPAELAILRKESKVQGMMAVLIKPLLGTANLLFVVDLWFLGGSITDLAFSVGPSLLSLLISLPLRKIEDRVKALPCATEDLRKEWLDIQQG